MADQPAPDVDRDQLLAALDRPGPVWQAARAALHGGSSYAVMGRAADRRQLLDVYARAEAHRHERGLPAEGHAEVVADLSRTAHPLLRLATISGPEQRFQLFLTPDGEPFAVVACLALEVG